MTKTIRFLAAASLLTAACSDGKWSGGPAAAPPPASPPAPGPSAKNDAPGPVSSNLPVAPDAGVDAAPPRTRVPMFIAQGKLGRRTISCDDGRTWIENHDEGDADMRCWDTNAVKNVECDHNPWSSVGMVEAHGYVLATFGWGYPGVVRRTDDGVKWDDVFPGHTFAGMAYGNGRVVANDRAPFVSTADGAMGSWTAGGDVGSGQWNVRRIGFIPDGGGRFVISLESSEGDIVWSDDNATTWNRAAERPTECARSVIGIVHANGVTLMAQYGGGVCRSTDRGDHWSYVQVSGGLGSSPLVVDGKFTIYDGATRWQSADGLTWTSAQGTDGIAPAAVARSDDGTYVATGGGWAVWYEKQELYRSTDGLNWEKLPTSAFVQSHPITHMVFAWMKPTAQCPLK
jgi:hypothetical protein